MPFKVIIRSLYSFFMPEGNYHYTMMSFRLKNARATYQQMVTRMFKKKIGEMVEVYIDVKVVKSKRNEELVPNLVEVFKILRQHKLCLNADKCAFGAGSGKFLGYMITTQGIGVNPNQISTIQELKPPTNPKEVQKLTGMIATLNRFVSRSADRCRPFFLLLEKWKGFQWMGKCDTVFKDLKSYLASLLVLSRPNPKKDLYMYLAVSDHTVSSVLLRHHEGIQRLGYYLSKTLVDAEFNIFR